MTSPNRFLISFGLLAALALGAFVLIMPPADLDLARDKPSAKGVYRVEITPESKPFDRSVLHAWVISIATPDGKPVDGASIAIEGRMPRHGHRLPTAPALTAGLGEGRYRIEGVRFNMAGWWEFRFRIKAGPGEDDVTFNLSL